MCKTYLYKSSPRRPHYLKNVGTDVRINHLESILNSHNKYNKIGYVEYDQKQKVRIYFCGDCFPAKLAEAPFCDSCSCPALCYVAEDWRITHNNNKCKIHGVTSSENDDLDSYLNYISYPDDFFL